MSALGRLKPPDWEHVRKYPLAALSPGEQPRGIPVTIGVNWYEDFDTPVRYGNRWFVCPNGQIRGKVRGGHCVCVKAEETDPVAWWRYYDQGKEGACVGFGTTRVMSDINRKRYDAFWLYYATQELGGYPGQEGAYVRDALEVLRTQGHVRVGHTTPDPSEGIKTYRWAQSVDEVVQVLNLPLARSLEAVPFINSWGEEYPHIVWMPFPVLERLIHEDGEIGIVTDK